MKKEILIVCVNYNSDDSLVRYIDTLQSSKENCNLDFNLILLIGDNSDNITYTSPEDTSFEIIHINNGDNLGYLGGVNKAFELSGISPYGFDFLIISNVDVKVSKTFFEDLLTTPLGDDVAWIAPTIFSEKERRDRNPKILYRPSRRKLKLTILMYRISLLYKLYVGLVYNKKDKKIYGKYNSDIIYAGHGSFFIFSNIFLKNIPDINYPSFLFGEEIFFGELIRNKGLKVQYVPQIKVYDEDHISTSKISRATLNKMNIDSLRYLLNNYF